MVNLIKRNNKKRTIQAFFTLIELIVTIVIMALVATIAVVQINREPAVLTIKNSAKQLKSMMLRASTQAVAMNIVVSLGYHKEKHAFFIVYDFNSLMQLPRAKQNYNSSNNDDESSSTDELSEEERMHLMIQRAANYSGNSYKLLEKITFCLNEPNDTQALDELAEKQENELDEKESDIEVLNENYNNSSQSADSDEEKPIIFARFYPDGTGFSEKAIISFGSIYYRIRVSPVTGYIYIEQIDENGDLIEE
ncbi:type II secretion system protein [Lentisphaerota bacterium WC36G]|nr:type II secretion system GspH family protein [Lentisphaerae bacterium WC36]